ncbi:MAG: SHOCT domain-containing protein [Actinobacteria bacterium]|nr:SHOCT domain-containing protein [Actinomycetota bacterium]
MLGGLVWISFWVILVWLLVALVRRPGGGDAPRAPSSEALGILEERYARGEISREEFLERRSVLTGTPPSGPASASGPAPPGQ